MSSHRRRDTLKTRGREEGESDRVCAMTPGKSPESPEERDEPREGNAREEEEDGGGWVGRGHGFWEAEVAVTRGWNLRL